MRQSLYNRIAAVGIGLVLTGLGAGPVLAGGSAGGGAPTGGASAACWGRLQVVPGIVRLGGTLVLRGSNYSCRTPQGQLGVPTVIEMYKPSVGLVVIKLPLSALRANGTYTLTVRLPRRLVTISSLMGPSRQYVRLQTGTYWFAIQTFGVGPPPPTNQALARVTVVP